MIYDAVTIRAELALIASFLLIILLVLQSRGTVGRNQVDAMLSGMLLFALAIIAGLLGCISILFLFIWPPATILAIGSLGVSYRAYGKAWQNWIFLQRLRGIHEEELSAPRTLTIYQLMVVTAFIAVACGLATLVHHAYTKTR